MVSSALYKSYSPRRLCPQHTTSPTTARDCVLSTLQVLQPSEIVSSAHYKSYNRQRLCPQHSTSPTALGDCVLSTLQVLQPPEIVSSALYKSYNRQRLVPQHLTHPIVYNPPEIVSSAGSSAPYKSYNRQRLCPQHLTRLTRLRDCVLSTFPVLQHSSDDFFTTLPVPKSLQHALNHTASARVRYMS